MVEQIPQAPAVALVPTVARRQAHFYQSFLTIILAESRLSKRDRPTVDTEIHQHAPAYRWTSAWLM